MRPVFLHLDNAIMDQPGLIDRGRRRGGLSLDARARGPMLRLWATNAELRKLKLWLKAELPPSNEPDLVFLGSGDFHHLSIVLIGRAVEKVGEQITVVHFDNHPDWMRFGFGVHCGSWAAQAGRLRGVARILTVGVCSADIVGRRQKGADAEPIERGQIELYALRAPGGADRVQFRDRAWPSIETIGIDAFAEYLLSRVETRAVYVTIDKDMLRASDAVTNWDQGQLSFQWLRAILARLVEARKLVGADVVGDYSRSAFGGPLATRLLKRGEAIWDQPWRTPDPTAAAQVNEPVNLALLDVLAGEYC